MRQPLFSVGEEVVLQSESSPELNGDCVVLEIVSIADLIRESLGANAMIIGLSLGIVEADMYGYRLTIPTGTAQNLWHESAIRKKHKPADESFKEMINNLNRIKAHA